MTLAAAPRTRPARRASDLPPVWLAFLIAGGVAVAAYRAASSVLVQDLLFVAIPALAAAATAVGVALHRPARALPWLIWCVGFVLSAAGNLVFAYHELVLAQSAPYPSWADVFFTVHFPVMALGLAACRLQSRSEDRATGVDALMVAVGLGVAAWAFVVSPAVLSSELGAVERTLSLRGWLGMVLILFLGLRLAADRGLRNRTIQLFMAALVPFVASEVVYGLQLLQGTYVTGGLVDSGWHVSMVLWGAAALHPAMRQFAAPGASTPSTFGPTRIAVLVGVILMPPVVALVQHLSGAEVSIAAVLVGSTVLPMLVLVRLVLLTRERTTYRRELVHQAYHDALTGLANRQQIQERLDEALAVEGEVAVLFVDLDRFKVVNDSLGHAVGDEILQAAAKRLAGCVRSDDLLARVGGDEFAVLMRGGDDGSLPYRVAERIVRAFEGPISTGAVELHVGASVGIATRGDAESAETLLRDADTAMYEAKRLGRNRWQLFRQELHERVYAHLQTVTDLRAGLGRGELRAHYQPIIDLGTGTAVAVEALVRWEHPERGLLPPGAFLPAAEDAGLVSEVDRWVLGAAVAQVAEWNRLHGPLALNVNVSPSHLLAGTLVHDIRALLALHGLDPGLLRIELTESAMVEDPDAAEAMLHAVAADGVQVALDDFGVGYSSLTHLRRFPLTLVKIDRSFLIQGGREGRDAAIVQALIALAHKLGLRVVAEGVERPEDLDRLRAWSCDEAQGYHFAKPLPPEELQAWLALTGVARAAAPAQPLP